MGNNPSKTKGPNLPAQVNWTQGILQIDEQKFTPPSGLIWRLPTEAEWEYSAKAGSTGPFYDTNYSTFTNNEKVYEQHLNKFGWYNKNSEGQVQPVAQKLNKLMGTFLICMGMYGNGVWIVPSSTRVTSTFPRFGATNPVNLDGEWKLLKGGSFSTDYTRCRFGYRGANAPSISNGDRGLRICLGLHSKRKRLNASKKQASSEDIEKLVEKLSPISLQKIPQQVS